MKFILAIFSMTFAVTSFAGDWGHIDGTYKSLTLAECKAGGHYLDHAATVKYSNDRACDKVTDPVKNIECEAKLVKKYAKYNQQLVLSIGAVEEEEGDLQDSFLVTVRELDKEESEIFDSKFEDFALGRIGRIDDKKRLLDFTNLYKSQNDDNFLIQTDALDTNWTKSRAMTLSMKRSSGVWEIFHFENGCTFEWAK